MPHSASAKKRHKQNLRNRERNRAAKSELKSHVRKVLSAIDAGDITQAREALRTVASSADKAAASHKIHRNKAARIKSRLSARMLSASKGGTVASPAKGSAVKSSAVKSGGAKSKTAKSSAAKSGGKASGGSKKAATKPKA
jgi:small subunit ribosomal protein S20